MTLNFIFSVLESNSGFSPNPRDLLSLQNDGIDVSFLEAFDPNMEIISGADATVEAIMSQLSVIIPQLAKLQDKRLLSNRPVELIDQTELRAAELIQKGLSNAIPKVEPGTVYSTESIRKSIGVKN